MGLALKHEGSAWPQRGLKLLREFLETWRACYEFECYEMDRELQMRFESILGAFEAWNQYRFIYREHKVRHAQEALRGLFSKWRAYALQRAGRSGMTTYWQEVQLTHSSYEWWSHAKAAGNLL